MSAVCSLSTLCSGQVVSWDPEEHTDLPGFAHALTRYAGHWFDVGISVVPRDVDPMEALDKAFAKLREICGERATAHQLLATWHAENLEEMRLPALYDLDQVAAWFYDAGFEVAASRLRVRFVPLAARHLNEGRLLDWLDYYYNQKILLRFNRPESAARN